MRPTLLPNRPFITPPSCLVLCLGFLNSWNGLAINGDRVWPRWSLQNRPTGLTQDKNLFYLAGCYLGKVTSENLLNRLHCADSDRILMGFPTRNNGDDRSETTLAFSWSLN